MRRVPLLWADDRSRCRAQRQIPASVQGLACAGSAVSLAVALALLVQLGTGLAAATAEPPASRSATGPAISRPATAPLAPANDPAQAIVAEGTWLYRQADLDALLLVAQRHAGRTYAGAELERLRGVLLSCLTARESLSAALDLLPAGFPAKGRERLALDLLDYRPPQRATPRPATASTPIAGNPVPLALPVAPASTPQPTAAATSAPVLVRLPPLTLNRSIENQGRRQLTIGLALYFTDAALAQALEEKAPLIQDAILGHVQQLPASEFVEPNQLLLKLGLTKAILARVPNFPIDGLLIPQLDSGPAGP